MDDGRRPGAALLATMSCLLAVSCGEGASNFASESAAAPAEAAAAASEPCAHVPVWQWSHEIPAESDSLLLVDGIGRLRKEQLVPSAASSDAAVLQREYSSSWAERRTVSFQAPTDPAGRWRVCATTWTDFGSFECRILTDTSQLYIHEGMLAFNLHVQWSANPGVTERWMGAIDL